MKKLAVPNTTDKNKPVTPQPATKTVPGQKGKIPDTKVVVEQEIKPATPKPKNLERFIYVTTYNDSETMKTLKELFETVNKEAFNLKSVKETFTKTLSIEEQNNNNIDYISGFQIIDNNLRITILEGITGKAMNKVKEKLPKLKMNDNSNKIYSDSRILFNTRIYSKFNLSMKFIKLRDNLNTILTTFDIYMKANKYNEIYTAFMNLGFILQSKTFNEISNANLL